VAREVNKPKTVGSKTPTKAKFLLNSNRQMKQQHLRLEQYLLGTIDRSQMNNPDI
jgi:hypothetical protein